MSSNTPYNADNFGPEDNPWSAEGLSNSPNADTVRKGVDKKVADSTGLKASGLFNRYPFVFTTIILSGLLVWFLIDLSQPAEVSPETTEPIGEARPAPQEISAHEEDGPAAAHARNMELEQKEEGDKHGDLVPLEVSGEEKPEQRNSMLENTVGTDNEAADKETVEEKSNERDETSPEPSDYVPEFTTGSNREVTGSRLSGGNTTTSSNSPLKGTISASSSSLMIKENLWVYENRTSDNADKVVGLNYSASDMPAYPGGDDRLLEHLRYEIGQIRLPDNISMTSRNTVIQFTVSPKGFIEDVKLLNTVPAVVESKIRQAIKTLETFSRGTKSGKKGSVIYQVSVTFD